MELNMKETTAIIAAIVLATNLFAQNANQPAGNLKTGEAKKPQVEEIVVVFKSHFDIGFTHLASEVVQRYRTIMIDNALKVGKRVCGFEQLCGLAPRKAQNPLCRMPDAIVWLPCESALSCV